MNGAEPGRSGDQRLTARQRDVLNLVVEGKSDGEIAAELGLSRSWVSEQIGLLRARFELSNRTALAVFAVRRGLV